MDLGKCSLLSLVPMTGTWFRAIPPQHFLTSLQTIHTKTIRSRFSAGASANPPFEILYLCENPTTALFEVGAQYATPSGRLVTDPSCSWLHINVDVVLQNVADLTDVNEQQLIDTSAQELTGDWAWYWKRRANSSVSGPTGIAPTQSLGQALFNRPDLEGFKAVSAKMPDHPNLIILPEKLQPGSVLKFKNPITNQVVRIP